MVSSEQTFLPLLELNLENESAARHIMFHHFVHRAPSRAVKCIGAQGFYLSQHGCRNLEGYFLHQSRHAQQKFLEVPRVGCIARFNL